MSGKRVTTTRAKGDKDGPERGSDSQTNECAANPYYLMIAIRMQKSDNTVSAVVTMFCAFRAAIAGRLGLRNLCFTDFNPNFQFKRLLLKTRHL